MMPDVPRMPTTTRTWTLSRALATTTMTVAALGRAWLPATGTDRDLLLTTTTTAAAAAAPPEAMD